MAYDIISQFSIRFADALSRPRCGSGLAATLPRLCHPGPALVEPLGPDPGPQRLVDRHHLGVAPAVVPYPDVRLVELAAVAPVPLRVGGSGSNTLIVLEVEWDSGVTVVSDEARNEGGAPLHVGHRADATARHEK